MRDLGDRYNVSRQTLTSRLKVATFTPLKRGQQNWFLPEHVEEMDRIDGLLRQGFSMSDVEDFAGDNPTTNQTIDIQATTTELTAPDLSQSNSLQLLASALSDALRPTEVDPLRHHELLSRAAQGQWLLTSKQLSECVGVSAATTHHWNAVEQKLGFTLTRAGRGIWRVSQ
ncbi:hypothetical protein OAL13_00290 [bacterium]|nr:hypothetical protein [bacterium]